MIVPYEHLSELRKLSTHAAHEMMNDANAWRAFCASFTILTE